MTTDEKLNRIKKELPSVIKTLYCADFDARNNLKESDGYDISALIKEALNELEELQKLIAD